MKLPGVFIDSHGWAVFGNSSKFYHNWYKENWIDLKVEIERRSWISWSQRSFENSTNSYVTLNYLPKDKLWLDLSESRENLQ